MKGLLLACCVLLSTSVFAEDEMTQTMMEDIVISLADEYRGRQGFLEFQAQGMAMQLISDAKNDRMRIVTPVIEYSRVTAEQKDRMLEANFHSALDARYAVNNGIVFATYIHPLSSLRPEQIEFAVYQVYQLRASFGDGYTSGALVFGQEKLL